MDPEIKRYLDQHGATYTPEALRKGLLDAGYDPAEVDAALRAWDAREAAGSDAEDRRTFGRWALWLHLGSLLAVFLVLIAMKGTTAIGTALLGCAVLGVALVIGWAISSAIGRALLPGGGVLIALVVPAISAIVLGGSCLALLSSAIGTPPRDATVNLEILAPRAFEGSGAASCYVGAGTPGVQVSSRPLGTLDGRSVRVDLSWYGRDTAIAPASSTSVSVLLDAPSETDRPESFGTIFSTHFEVTAAPDGLTGTIQFDGLALEPGEQPGQPPTPEVISGSVSWNCE
jgi:hypothetical protein